MTEPNQPRTEHSHPGEEINPEVDDRMAKRLARLQARQRGEPEKAVATPHLAGILWTTAFLTGMSVTLIVGVVLHELGVF